MAKSDTPSDYRTRPAYGDSKALVAALQELTVAISGKREVAQAATDAAVQYKGIKGVLRTHVEKDPNEDTAPTTSTPRPATTKY